MPEERATIDHLIILIKMELIEEIDKEREALEKEGRTVSRAFILSLYDRVWDCI